METLDRIQELLEEKPRVFIIKGSSLGANPDELTLEAPPEFQPEDLVIQSPGRWTAKAIRYGIPRRKRDTVHHGCF